MTDLLPVRVMVQDAWDEVRLDLPASTSLAQVKQQALAATRVIRDPAGYLANEGRDGKALIEGAMRHKKSFNTDAQGPPLQYLGRRTSPT